jgi:hypothetical protein
MPEMRVAATLPFADGIERSELCGNSVRRGG